jgi:hypothetical protein
MRCLIRAAGGCRPARRDHKTGELILAESRIVKAILWSALLGSPVLAAALSLISPTPNERLGMWFIGVAFAMMGAVGILACERFDVSPLLIRKRGPLFLHRQRMWNELTAIELDRGCGLTLLFRDGGRMKVESNLIGFRELLDQVDLYAPRKVRSDAAEDLNQLRSFLS